MTIINTPKIIPPQPLPKTPVSIHQFSTIKSCLRTAHAHGEILHVIVPYMNPEGFQTRRRLMAEFLDRMRIETRIQIYVVELVVNGAKNQEFQFAQENCATHLRLTSEFALWYKENLINIGIKFLLPKKWKYVAWIDADIEFQNIHWVKDALKLLSSDTYDIVQLFSHADDMDLDGTSMGIYASAGYHIARGLPYSPIAPSPNYSHPGYAWAASRHAIEQMGGLIEFSIIGSGDWLMTLCLVGKIDRATGNGWTEGYRNYLNEIQRRYSFDDAPLAHNKTSFLRAGVPAPQKLSGENVIAKTINKNGLFASFCNRLFGKPQTNVQGGPLKFGYVTGVINHYFHGKKENRQYNTRWKILFDAKFDPKTHITNDTTNYDLLVPTEKCPPEMLRQIREYFVSRKEDE